MPHLVAPVLDATPIGQVLREINEAHSFLNLEGRVAARRIVGVGDEHWGVQVKRINVLLPKDKRPHLCRDAPDEHSFSEVVNQCATLTRLIDALAWTSEQWPNAVVTRCHPTTSSRKRHGVPDNDLMVRLEGRRALRFEVSDVASEKDGNGKEFKDLVSLGALASRERRSRTKPWPRARLFLVVSEEFSRRMMRLKKRRLEKEGIRYCMVGRPSSTRIIEVLPVTRRCP